MTAGLTCSTDPNYSGRAVRVVTLTNLDNRAVAGIKVVSPVAGTTTEAGGAATFTVVLTSKPTADVSIPLKSSNPKEGDSTAASLTFTPLNWNVPQKVTVTGVDDAVRDGDVTYKIATGPAVSADRLYNGRAAADVTLTNLDNEPPTVSDFDGDDTGSYSGTMSGGLTFHVANGAITVTNLPDYVDFAGGTVALNGVVTITIPSSLAPGMRFSGTFHRGVNGAVTVNGTVTNLTPTLQAIGTWSATRDPLTTPPPA